MPRTGKMSGVMRRTMRTWWSIPSRFHIEIEWVFRYSKPGNNEIGIPWVHFPRNEKMSIADPWGQLRTSFYHYKHVTFCLKIPNC
jgi:hypothetical protein